ncbi:MAG: hypothetical protein EO766_13150 [Hydrotalea sp. AMD]|uniref:hypothetical protein n=1 Tax=Hydrotalea TaxID=1004300 RepID=UPI0009437E24|nr:MULTISPECIES: hypothetical protein [Hydrotalea]RWZ83462.1 MAG: hypothetical protein EO766_17740 [Hydrotalea sp. AMD]RWZ83483.1 MAG: hypothetical protein EO766_17690 [Hydrotalea sp. AMD]RWZ86747.1 MAG: hypothetical protein EO766_13150 [Hydrotalea sp. AMD]
MSEQKNEPKFKEQTNKELFEELWERGYFVMKLTRDGDDDIDYLVVSTLPPKDEVPIDHNAN